MNTTTPRIPRVRLVIAAIATALLAATLAPQGTAQASAQKAACPEPTAKQLPAVAAKAAAGPLSEQPSGTIGTIGWMAPDPGKPCWDEASRSNDVAFFGDRYAIVVGRMEAYIKGGTPHPRPGLVIINMLTGQPTGVSLPIKGEILTVKISSGGGAAYIGGNFDVKVDGETRHNAAKFNLSTGDLYPWNPKVNGVVNDIDLGGKKRNKVLMAGTFTSPRPYFASVTQTSGALTEFVTVRVAGGQDGPTLGFNFVTNSLGTLMIGTGSFTSVNGKVHDRMFVLKAVKGRAKLRPWATKYTTNPCSPNKTHEELGVTFAGEFKFGIAATGAGARARSTCDTVSVWTLKKELKNTNAKPLWRNYTSHDSMSAVSFFRGYTQAAGHNKGCNTSSATPTPAQTYNGLCQYNTKTGALSSWKPTTSRQRSMHVRLVPTPAGFLVQGVFYAGDANMIGGEERNNIAFFPAL